MLWKFPLFLCKIYNFLNQKMSKSTNFSLDFCPPRCYYIVITGSAAAAIEQGFDISK